MENLNNLAPFFVGQKVVAVDAMPNSTIKNGQTYTITHCYYAPSGNPIAKGGWFWYVGVVGNDNKSLRPTIFAPLQEQKFPLIKLKKIIEKELVSAN
jgi:hypothetical protein